jgi:hypothetical protein
VIGECRKRSTAILMDFRSGSVALGPAPGAAPQLHLETEYAVALEPPPPKWTGFYVGLNAGNERFLDGRRPGWSFPQRPK